MNYEIPLYRPPSEANSLIFQITIGCSYNRCKFCYMYRGKRFRIKRTDVIKEEIDEASKYEPYTERIFLADGDALVIRTDMMIDILYYMRKRFAHLKRVSAYASPSNILDKSLSELRDIQEAGLKLLYIGVESGDDEILKMVDKGADRKDIIRSIKKAGEAGFRTSTTVILGLGGRERSRQHSENTASLVNEAEPDYLSLLTLMLGPFEENYINDVGGSLSLLDPIETLVEIREIIKGINIKGVIFRTNHASNYLPLKGTLSEDKVRLINILNRAIEDPTGSYLRPEYMRGL